MHWVQIAPCTASSLIYTIDYIGFALPHVWNLVLIFIGSVKPTVKPTMKPSSKPSVKPSAKPSTCQPTSRPSSRWLNLSTSSRPLNSRDFCLVSWLYRCLHLWLGDTVSLSCTISNSKMNSHHETFLTFVPLHINLTHPVLPPFPPSPSLHLSLLSQAYLAPNKPSHIVSCEEFDMT